jgi:hypothetical protein
MTDDQYRALLTHIRIVIALLVLLVVIQLLGSIAALMFTSGKSAQGAERAARSPRYFLRKGATGREMRNWTDHQGWRMQRRGGRWQRFASLFVGPVAPYDFVAGKNKGPSFSGRGPFARGRLISLASNASRSWARHGKRRVNACPITIDAI